jgi:hypothetical protein
VRRIVQVLPEPLDHRVGFYSKTRIRSRRENGGKRPSMSGEFKEVCGPWGRS